MNEDETPTEKQGDNRLEALKPYQYKKGQSGNPGGRPVGSVSMKTYLKNKLLSMTDDEREIFLEGIDKKAIFEMAEGKPKQDIEATMEVTSKIIRLDIE